MPKGSCHCKHADRHPHDDQIERAIQIAEVSVAAHPPEGFSRDEVAAFARHHQRHLGRLARCMIARRAAGEHR